MILVEHFSDHMLELFFKLKYFNERGLLSISQQTSRADVLQFQPIRSPTPCEAALNIKATPFAAIVPLWLFSRF